MSARQNYLIYLDARIHARRGDLLPVSSYEEMLAYNDIGLVVKHLLSTPYEREIADALLHHQDGDAVEAGVGRHLDRIFRELMRFAARMPGSGGELAFFMRRWDLTAIKAQLRRAAHGSAGIFTDLCTGPSLPWPLVESLAASAGLEELVPRLRLLFPDICRGLPAILESGADNPSVLLQALETELDNAFFGRFPPFALRRGNTGRVLAEYMALEVDRINIRTALSEVSWKARQGEPPRWLKGGVVTPEMLDAMLASGSMEEAIIILESSPYRAVHQVFYHAVLQGRLSGLDRRFEMIFVEKLQKLVHTRPFGGALFMQYVWMKSMEAANLRILARGAEARLPAGRIREELIYV